jgi:hypothetical protein
MPERIAAVVRQRPKRGFSLVVGLAVLIAAIVLSVNWFSGSSGATATGHRVRHARAARPGSHHDRGSATSLNPAQIDANVNRLLNQMTVAEKFGQLEMAGPSNPEAI